MHECTFSGVFRVFPAIICENSRFRYTFTQCRDFIRDWKYWNYWSFSWSRLGTLTERPCLIEIQFSIPCNHIKVCLPHYSTLPSHSRYHVSNFKVYYQIKLAFKSKKYDLQEACMEFRRQTHLWRKPCIFLCTPNQYENFQLGSNTILSLWQNVWDLPSFCLNCSLRMDFGFSRMLQK